MEPLHTPPGPDRVPHMECWAKLPATIVLSAALLAGCATRPDRGGAGPPSPEFIGAGTLELPPDCQAEQGVMYRTTFVVEADGHVSNARSEGGDGCVQQALRRWVTSFTYRATGGATPVAFDWMVVTGTRGG